MHVSDNHSPPHGSRSAHPARSDGAAPRRLALCSICPSGCPRRCASRWAWARRARDRHHCRHGAARPSLCGGAASGRPGPRHRARPAPEAIALLAEPFAAPATRPARTPAHHCRCAVPAWLRALTPPTATTSAPCCRHHARQALTMERLARPAAIRALANAGRAEWTTRAGGHCVPTGRPVTRAPPPALHRRGHRAYDLPATLMARAYSSSTWRDLGVDLTAGPLPAGGRRIADATAWPPPTCWPARGGRPTYRHWLDEADRHLADGMGAYGCLPAARAASAPLAAGRLHLATIAALLAPAPCASGEGAAPRKCAPCCCALAVPVGAAHWPPAV